MACWVVRKLIMYSDLYRRKSKKLAESLQSKTSPQAENLTFYSTRTTVDERGFSTCQWLKWYSPDLPKSREVGFTGQSWSRDHRVGLVQHQGVFNRRKIMPLATYISVHMFGRYSSEASTMAFSRYFFIVCLCMRACVSVRVYLRI